MTSRLKLEDIASIIDSRHKTPSYSDDGYPMVRVVDIKGGNLNLENCKRVAKAIYDDFSKGRDPQIGDLVFSRVGSYGNVSIAKTDSKFCLGQNTVAIIPNDKDIYLYYALQSSSVKAQIESSVVGAVQKTISLKSIKNLEIPYPDANKRAEIVQILSCLDDKLHTNKSMNQTLEKIAQRIFKSWFIDFDPVKANAEGLPFAGLSPDIQSLFPSEFIESEMGLIPKGWEVKSLDELYDVGIGKTPPRKEHEWFTKSNDDVIWISIKDMGGDEVFNLDSSEKLTIKSIEKFNVKLVPSNSVIMSFKMTVGRLSITTHECATNEAIAHFKHCGKTTVSSPQLYLSLKSVNFDSYGSTSSIATAINSKIVKSIKIITPPDELNLAFAELIFPMFDKIKNNQLNSESLNKLKNKLLPKLLSGQIQIDEQKKAS